MTKNSHPLVKLKKEMVVLVAVIVLVLLFLAALIYILLIDSYGNDSMPVILTQRVQQKRLWWYPEDKTLVPGLPCTDENIKAYIFTINSTYTPQHRCEIFQFGPNVQLYFIQFYPGFFLQRFVLKSSPGLEEVMINGGEYPGNSVYDVRGDGQRVIFTYEGWNNPKKIIELSPSTL